MSDKLITSAKRLGWLNMPDFCPRCFYLLKSLNWKKPWSLPMPVYMALDSIQKRYIHRIIDETNAPPSWLHDPGEINGYIEPPHWNNFFYESDSGVRVRGQADLILKRPNGNICIVDLKTSGSDPTRDMLMPTYVVQQNVYAMAAEQMGIGKVDSISLLYMAIQKDKSVAADIDPGVGGNIAYFKARRHELPRKNALVEFLCLKYRDLCALKEMPSPHSDCKECEMIRQLAELFAFATTKGTAVANDSNPAQRIVPSRAIYAQYFGCAK